MNQQQHGDVIIHRIEKMPEKTKVVAAKDGRLILAEGEATGHAHTIVATSDVQLREAEDGTLYLSTNSDVELMHEEHHTQTIEPGVYEIGIVVEVDPFEDEVRRVAD